MLTLSPLTDSWPTASIPSLYGECIQASELRPIEVNCPSTATLPEVSGIVFPTTRPQFDKEFLPPILPKSREIPDDIADAVVLQLWEGRVLSVDADTQSMRALLTAKMGQVPDHSAQFELQWVSDQDLDLVKPGAVFYLTLYKQILRGSIRNSQELRFRRRPSWSQHQIMQIQAEAQALVSKMKPRPFADD